MADLEPDLAYHEEARFLMGTMAVVAGWAPTAEQATAAVDAAFREMERQEKVFSTWNDRSELAKINARAGLGPARVSKDLGHVLNVALELARLSGGAFDPTVLPLVKLWGFRDQGPAVYPTAEVVAETLKLVNHENVVQSAVDNQVQLRLSDMALDFGGIAKGWALEKAAEIMNSHGAVAGRLDLGGGILVFGAAAAQTVGIVDPQAEGHIGRVLLQDAAMATSGQYERHRESEGRTWGHILDPRTGYPVEHLLSVTVVSESATVADAAATACFVLGKTEGLRFLESLPGCEGIIIAPSAQGEPEIISTSGW